MVLDVGRSGDRIQELSQVGEPPGGLQLTGILELLAEGDDIDDIPSLEEAGHGPVEPAMGLPVEHGIPDDLDGPGHRIPIDEHPTQDRNLRFGGKRRLAVEVRGSRGHDGFWLIHDSVVLPVTNGNAGSARHLGGPTLRRRP